MPKVTTLKLELFGERADLPEPCSIHTLRAVARTAIRALAYPQIVIPRMGSGMIQDYTQEMGDISHMRIAPRTAVAHEDRLRATVESLGSYYPNDTPFLDALVRGLPRRPPPSRYTRLRWQLRAAQRRAGDAWRVLWHGLPEHDD